MKISNFFLKNSLILLLLATFLNELLWINTVPFNAAPDELSHFDVIARFVSSGHYPVAGEEPQKLLTRGMDIWGYQNTYQPYPYLFASLPVFLFKNLTKPIFWYLFARISSAISIVIFTAILYKLLQLVTKNRQLALIWAGVAAFIPQISFIGAYVNYDSFTLTISSLLVFLTTKFYLDKVKGSKQILMLGIILGIAILSRSNAYPLASICFIFILIVIFCQKYPLRNFLIFSGSILMLSSWWFIQNFQKYHELIPQATSKIFQQYQNAHPWEFIHMSFFQVITKTNWLPVTLLSFYAGFDWNLIFLPLEVYFPFYFYAIVGLILFLKKFPQFSKKLRSLHLLYLAVIILTAISAVYYSAKVSFQAQGRYLFPALPIILEIIALGLQSKLKYLWILPLFIFTIYSNLLSLFVIIPNTEEKLILLQNHIRIPLKLISPRPLIFSETSFGIITIIYLLILFLFITNVFFLIRVNHKSSNG